MPRAGGLREQAAPRDPERPAGGPHLTLPDKGVEAEQTRLLLHNPVDVPANLLNAALVGVVVWPLYPAWVPALWLGLVGIVSVARSSLRHRYARAVGTEQLSPKWTRRFTLNALVAGCLWGLAGSVMLVTPNPIYYTFIVFVLGGTMAGGVVCIAANLRAMLAFVLPVILPAILALAVRGGLIQVEMALMLALFTCALLWTGRSFHESLTENIRLRFGQQHLVTSLRSSEASMAETQAMAQVGTWEIEPHSLVHTWSAEMYRMFGVAPAAFHPALESVLARVHADDRKFVRGEYAAILATGATRGFEHRIVLDDGAIKHVHQSGRAVRDASGRIVKVSGFAQDVSERRQREAASASLAAIVDASVDAIYAQTVAGTIVSWNKGAEHLFGYGADEAIGQSIRMIIPEDRREEIDSNLAALASGQRIDPFDSERMRKDGARTPVSISVALTRDAAQTVVGASFIMRDITERQLAAGALAYRDQLLHAVTIGTGTLIKAQSLGLEMPEALRVIGEGMGVDRVLVIQAMEGQEPALALRHCWEVANIHVPITGTQFPVDDMGPLVVASWLGSLRAGKPVTAHVASSEGPVRELLESLRNQSTILVPIFVRDMFWGALCADDCTRAREWNASEIDALVTFADTTGSLIRRTETLHLLETSEARFRTLTGAAPDAIVAIDEVGIITQWNAAAERILGYSAEEALGHPAHHVLAPPGRQDEADPVLPAGRRPGGSLLELTVVTKDQSEIAVEIAVAGAQIGGHWETIGILRNITERKRAGEQLAFANLLLRTQLEASRDGILIVDENKAIIAYNHLFATIWQVAPSDLAAGRDDPVLATVASSVRDAAGFTDRVQYLYDHPGEDSQDELELIDGRSIDRYSVTLYSPARAYLGRVWFFRDITERKRNEALALRTARYDVLTGLANRAVFVETLQHAIATAKRGEMRFALLYLDLDHFKDVNDTLGHPVGDELLKAVADRLLAYTRETDTVARFGGDEFAVIVTDIRDPADAAIVADKLTVALAMPFSVDETDIHSGASIGIAAYGTDATDAEALLSHADVALYRAKSENRGGFRFFTDAMDTEVRMRVALGAELRVAVDQAQLFLLYQPQVEIESGRITGVEALVRWRHPGRGVLCPSLFIPIAERIGIIARVGHWVLWEACRQGRAWLDAGIAPARISVNVSALQFRTPLALEADIVAALAQTGLPAHVLELELTESVLMDVSREHSDLLTHLRDTGVTVAIDDFGTGYSSLDYLRRYPTNRIKIAQNFVTNLEATPGNAAIVRATIGLARELHIDVIAEGVESQAQCDLLKGWGCGEVQGFFFSEPLTAEDVEDVLREGRILPPPA